MNARTFPPLPPSLPSLPVLCSGVSRIIASEKGGGQGIEAAERVGFFVLRMG